MGWQHILELHHGSKQLEGLSELESTMACELIECLIRSAAGVISGVKPASLFNYVPRAHRSCEGAWCEVCATERKALRACADELERFGLRLIVLYRRAGKVALFVYRPNEIARILGDESNCTFLTTFGYKTSSVETVIREFRKRMATYYGSHNRHLATFPHEVGLLLGYPLKDVLGFIAGERESCRGPWKAYGNVEEALALFRRVASCERLCRERFSGGESLAALLTCPIVQ